MDVYKSVGLVRDAIQGPIQRTITRLQLKHNPTCTKKSFECVLSHDPNGGSPYSGEKILVHETYALSEAL